MPTTVSFLVLPDRESMWLSVPSIPLTEPRQYHTRSLGAIMKAVALSRDHYIPHLAQDDQK